MKKILTIMLLLFICLFVSCENKDKIENSEPVTVTLWHYYNGAQKVALDKLINEFNNTIGSEKGIIVEGYSQGNIQDLINRVEDAANKKVGAGEMPNIFAAYPDIAYEVDKLGLVTEINKYLSEDEIKEYVPGYIEEGYIDGSNKLKIFPVAKSTEVMAINKTDWDKFSKEAGAEISELETIEGVIEVAEKYYKWTDSLTDEANDGKAFFGRDSLANYFVIGCKQLGVDIFSVENGNVKINADKKVIKRLWDNFYVPYISGYFASYGRFGTDDIKTGDTIAVVGSTSSLSYFPTKVTIGDKQSYPIESLILKAPIFKNGDKVAVQQGAGMVVTKSNEKEEKASIEFLKWFTSEDININFSLESYYLPVKINSNKINKINSVIDKSKDYGEKISSLLPVAMETINNYELYNSKAFKGGTSARDVLEKDLIGKAKEDVEKVNELVKKGISREKAVVMINSEDNFNTWYEAFINKLNTSIK